MKSLLTHPSSCPDANLLISGVTIGPADPALQVGAVLGGRKIARKCGTFFGKLNCSTSKSTRFRLKTYFFFKFLPSFSLFCRDLIWKETFNKTASWGDRGRQMGDGRRGRQQGGAHTQRYATAPDQVFLDSEKENTEIKCSEAHYDFDTDAFRNIIDCYSM